MAVILVLRISKNYVQNEMRIFRFFLSLFTIYYLMYIYILYIPTFGGQVKLSQSCPKAIEDGDTSI